MLVSLLGVGWAPVQMPVRPHLVPLPVQSHTAPYSQLFSEQDEPSSFLRWGQDLPTVTLAAEDS